MKVIYGVNELEMRFAGSTPAQVRRRVSSLLNIDPEAKPRIDGNPVDEQSYTIQEGDDFLEFVKSSGAKGA